MASSSLENLCQFTSQLELGEVDPSIISHARLVFVDTVGVITAGSTSDEVSKLLVQLSEKDESGESSCLGLSQKISPLVASLVNGISGSSLEFEEGNSWAMGHPAIQMVPAILAACEKRKSSGEELLAALIGGYESAARVSRASSLRKGLHPAGTWGTVGAALGVGRVYRRTAEELHKIANISASFAITPYVKNSFVGMNVASTFAGVTNYFGILSNIFFDCGIRADEASLRMTFSRFLSDGFQEESLDKGLGKEYFISANYFKPYPSCRFTHSSIDALKEVLQKSFFGPNEVEKIRVETFQAAMHCDTKAPFNKEAIRFSIPYLCALLILYGDVSLDTMERVSIDDPQLKALAEKVEMVLLPKYEELRPNYNPTRVIVQLRDGKTFSHEVKDALGSQLNRFGEEAVFKKFISLTSPIIGRDRAEIFLERCSQLEKEENMDRLIRLLCPIEGENRKAG
jgi:2-methylcitrate dehydratase PrpD